MPRISTHISFRLEERFRPLQMCCAVHVHKSRSTLATFTYQGLPREYVGVKAHPALGHVHASVYEDIPLQCTRVVFSKRDRYHIIDGSRRCICASACACVYVCMCEFACMCACTCTCMCVCTQCVYERKYIHCKQLLHKRYCIPRRMIVPTLSIHKVRMAINYETLCTLVQYMVINASILQTQGFQH